MAWCPVVALGKRGRFVGRWRTSPQATEISLAQKKHAALGSSPRSALASKRSSCSPMVCESHALAIKVLRERAQGPRGVQTRGDEGQLAKKDRGTWQAILSLALSPINERTAQPGAPRRKHPVLGKGNGRIWGIHDSSVPANRAGRAGLKEARREKKSEEGKKIKFVRSELFFSPPHS